MTRNHSKAELAQALGVSTRTIERWLQEGCPCVLRDGQRMFSVDEVRRWQQAAGLTGRAGRPSHDDALGEAPHSARQNLAKAELARKLTAARKNELELNAERSLKELGLDKKLRATRSLEDLSRVTLEISALLANGDLVPARARALQAMLDQARKALQAQAEVAGPESSERIFLCTEEGGKLLRLFEGIVSDDRRQRVMSHVVGQAEEDLLEFPNAESVLTRGA